MTQSLEEFFDDTKRYQGLTQYETRSWVCWHPHMPLLGLEHPFVRVTRLRLKKVPGLTLDRTIRLPEAVFGAPVLKSPHAVAPTEYYSRRNEHHDDTLIRGKLRPRFPPGHRRGEDRSTGIFLSLHVGAAVLRR